MWQMFLNANVMQFMAQAVHSDFFNTQTSDCFCLAVPLSELGVVALQLLDAQQLPWYDSGKRFKKI
jgi:hypothetical protein